MEKQSSIPPFFVDVRVNGIDVSTLNDCVSFNDEERNVDVEVGGKRKTRDSWK